MAHVSNVPTRPFLRTAKLACPLPLTGPPLIITNHRFSVLHAEHLPSAIARYSEQVSRILSVLNGALEGKKWLVGDKCTYADLAFIMWNAILPLVGYKAEGVDPLGEYLNVKAWQERMRARSAVAKVLGMREECMKKDMLGTDGLPVGIDLDEMRKRM